MIKVITCPRCNTTIYSRAHHDFHSCLCKAYSIDGGFEYTRICFPPDAEKGPECFEIEVDATKQELYDDWNNSLNKFGIIYPKTSNNKKEKNHANNNKM